MRNGLFKRRTRLEGHAANGPGSVRLDSLRSVMALARIDGMLITGRANTQWLTGFTGTLSWLLVTSNEAILLVDSRYALQARVQVMPGVDTVVFSGRDSTALEQQLSRCRVQVLGYEGDDMTVSAFDSMREQVRTPKRFHNLSPELVMMRAVKDENECFAIQHAASVGDAAYAAMFDRIRPGVTERWLAKELEVLMLQSGASGTAFSTIVASGPQAALPHAVPSERKLQSGDVLLMDFGVRWNGYCSDMTRTLFLGEPDSDMRRMYDVVLEAQETAMKGIRPGMKGSQADALARRVIEDAGYGEGFAHSLGHGAGLCIHEAPRLSAASSDEMEPGMVVTLEPGIYLEGRFGIRIEDIGVIRADGFSCFTQASKALQVL